MREIDTYRRTLREQSQQSAGRYPGWAPVRLAEIADGGAAAEILRLPDDIEHLDPIQDETTGAWLFMLDVSVLDGPDPLA
jgi:hypothetical protein